MTGTVTGGYFDGPPRIRVSFYSVEDVAGGAATDEQPFRDRSEPLRSACFPMFIDSDPGYCHALNSVGRWILRAYASGGVPKSCQFMCLDWR